MGERWSRSSLLLQPGFSLFLRLPLQLLQRQFPLLSLQLFL